MSVYICQQNQKLIVYLSYPTAYKMPLPESLKLPQICCQLTNHHKSTLQFLCLNKECLTYNKNPLCYYCLQQSHKDHQKETISMQGFISECLKVARSKNEELKGLTNQQHQQFYQLESMLLKGFVCCNSREEISRVLEQIYRAVYTIGSYSTHSRRIQNLLNQQTIQIKTKNENLYLNANKQQSSHHQHETKNHHSLTKNTQFSIPIISFTPLTPNSSHFRLISPFEVKHNKSNTLSSIITHPSLSTFTESLEIFIKVLKLTPNWMGIGISISESKYEQKSKNHITLLSNGWINQRGSLRKQSNMKFQTGHVIKLQWNKQKNQLIFRNVDTRNQEVIAFSPQWNEDIFLCVSMFFNSDSVTVLQSGQK